MTKSEAMRLMGKMIRLDEKYCDGMNEVFDDCLNAMSPERARLGKKLICDSMAVSKAVVGVEISKLMLEDAEPGLDDSG